MNKLWIAVGGLLAGLALAGCTSTTPGQGVSESPSPVSLAEARAAALEQVAEWVFVESPRQVRDRINAADSVAEVASALEVAERENTEIAARFWGCVDQMQGHLVGVWNGQQIDASGKVFNDYLLTLDEDGSAGLELIGSAQMVGELSPGEAGLWLAANAGRVSSWSADLDEAIAERRLPDGWSPVHTGKYGQCDMRFTLVLDDTGWDARLQLDAEEDAWTLLLDDSAVFDPFDGEE